LMKYVCGSLSDFGRWSFARNFSCIKFSLPL
jgi:hypothetical protein